MEFWRRSWWTDGRNFLLMLLLLYLVICSASLTSSLLQQRWSNIRRFSVPIHLKISNENENAVNTQERYCNLSSLQFFVMWNCFSLPRVTKGTQESDVRANLRTTVEIVSNRSQYSSKDYFPDIEDGQKSFEVKQEFLNSLQSRRSYISILVERFAQSIDDFQLASQTKRGNYNKNGYALDVDSRLKERIVVLGSGWGSHSFLKVLSFDWVNIT